MPREKTGGLVCIGTGMFTVPFAVLAKDVRGSFSGIDNFMDFFPVWRVGRTESRIISYYLLFVGISKVRGVRATTTYFLSRPPKKIRDNTK